MPGRGRPVFESPLPALSPARLRIPGRLAGLDLRRLPLLRFDVIVIGGGAAGASAALSAAGEGAAVALLTKARLEQGNTLWAQGGVAAVLSEHDSFEAHVADTLEVGCGLCEPSVVEHVIRRGPGAIERLIKRGAQFDREADGNIALSREGGHSFARVLHANGDATGRELQRALMASLLEAEGIECFDHTFVVDLMLEEGGGVCGAVALADDGTWFGFTASQVILATGGSGQLYRETTNPNIATGDGLALGLRAGAALRDLEFYQFHPTCLYIAGAARVLISEIVRGHGGRLRDRNGERFMSEFHPDAELAPRDVVSRAVAEQMARSQDTNVYLDLSAVDGDPHKLFPGISRTCQLFGIDIARDFVPVRPGAHYQIGGLEVDLSGRTSVEGLWAVGEVASTGLHGANRMGSNSLLEGLVLGEEAGRRAAGCVREVARGRIRAERDDLLVERGEVTVNADDVLYSLKSMMWRQMGVVRRAPDLADALTRIDLWMRAVVGLSPPNRSSYELINMLTVARLAFGAADFRTESRGAHFRSDHPERDKALWQAHTRILPGRDGDWIESLEFEKSALVSEAVGTPGNSR